MSERAYLVKLENFKATYMRPATSEEEETDDSPSSTDSDPISSFLEEIDRRLEGATSSVVEDHQRFGDLLVNYFFNELTSEEMYHFVEDLLLETEAVTDELFDSHRVVTASEMAFDWMVELPLASLKKAADAFDRIFDRALREEYGDLSRLVCDKIRTLTIENGSGLSGKYLRDKLSTPGLLPLIRFELLSMLVQLQGFSDQLFMDRMTQNLDEEPYLAPIVIEQSRSRHHPEKLLAILKEVDHARNTVDLEAFRSSFRSSIFECLYQYLTVDPEQRVKAYFSLKESLTKRWLLTLLDEVEEHPRLGVMQEIFHTNKVNKVKMGNEIEKSLAEESRQIFNDLLKDPKRGPAVAKAIGSNTETDKWEDILKLIRKEFLRPGRFSATKRERKLDPFGPFLFALADEITDFNRTFKRITGGFIFDIRGKEIYRYIHSPDDGEYIYSFVDSEIEVIQAVQQQQKLFGSKDREKLLLEITDELQKADENPS